MPYYPKMPDPGSVSWAIMAGDHMFNPRDPKHYERVGESAMRNIFSALLLANAQEPRAVLDFACGSGRVSRWLRVAFPDAVFDVSDVRDDSLAFCTSAFGCTAWRSSDDLDAVSAPRSYDLIWSGSLLTHLSERASILFMRKFAQWLTPGGVAVFTTHGRKAAENMRSGIAKYIPPEQNAGVLSAYDQTGYGYVPYAPGRDIGFSMNSLGWLVRQTEALGLRLLLAAEHSWDNHQDVIAIQKVA